MGNDKQPSALNNSRDPADDLKHLQEQSAKGGKADTPRDVGKKFAVGVGQDSETEFSKKCENGERFSRSLLDNLSAMEGMGV